MITYRDIQIPGKSSYTDCGLSLLTGKKIKEIHGHLSTELGGVTFVLSRIEFEDGTFIGVEGEHDLPYLASYAQEPPNMDDETMERLEREQSRAWSEDK